MSLPENIDCVNNSSNCDYFMNYKLCKNTCIFAQRIKKGISHQARTGLERFMERYGENWRLIAYGEQGSIPLSKEKQALDKLFTEDMRDF